MYVQMEEQVKQWVDGYTENYAHFSTLAESTPTSTSQFSSIYHSLIHSSALATLLQLEHTYAIEVDDICQARDTALNVMQRRWAESDKIDFQTTHTHIFQRQLYAYYLTKCLIKFKDGLTWFPAHQNNEKISFNLIIRISAKQMYKYNGDHYRMAVEIQQVDSPITPLKSLPTDVQNPITLIPA